MIVYSVVEVMVLIFIVFHMIHYNIANMVF